MKKALIIIDLQKGFINSSTKGLPLKIKKYIIQNRKNFDLILFTQFKNYKNSHFVKILNYYGFMKPDEYEIVEELKEFVAQDNLFIKSTYGSFTDNRMLGVLKRNKINEVYLMGIATENCVLTFARDTFDRGFAVTVLKDYCDSDTDKKMHLAALKIIRDNIGQVK